MRRSPFRLVTLTALAVLALVVSAAPAAAVQSTLDLLLDLDNDAATGCTVVTPDGPFDGVEQILTTTIDTVGAATADVTGVERRECVDPGTDTFGAPIAVDPGVWPVGVGLGVDGFDVVETYFPLAALPATSLDLSVVRFGVVHTRGRVADTLLVASPGSDVPLLLDLRSVLEIPTLGEWGLLLLALLLAASSLALLGRRGRVALVVVLLLGTAGLAYAQCVLDGLPDDWGPGDLPGEDVAAADDGISIRAVFGRGEAAALCFRVDLSLQFDQPPTITPIADQVIPEDGTTGALAFTVGDLETAAAALVVTATSSNQLLVPDANLVLGGAGANRTITVTPAANQNGMTTVTVTVQDGAGNTASTSFLVTVTSQNDPPTITPIADQVILEDSTTGPLAFTVGDTETAAGSLVVSASSNNTAIIPNANLVLGGAGANRTITVTPAADQNGGPVTITVLVQDADGGSVPTQFTVTVTPVNDVPSFTLGGDVASDEDAGAQVVMGQATAISPGPANEAGQTVSFLVSNDNNALFSAQPAIDAAGTLTYTSALNAFGTAIVTVQAMDDGGTANGGVDTSAAQMFTITVNAVNDPPMLTTNVINYSAVGNTLLRVDGATDGVAGHDVPLPGRIASTTSATDAFMAVGPLDPDTPPANLGFVPGAYPTMLGGLVTIDDDGDFFYVPPVGVQGMDTVVLTFTDGATNLPVTLNITISEMVWYVEDTVDGTKNPTAGGPGNSLDAFETLAAAEAASGPNDYILVLETDAPLDQTITLKSGQKLYGQPIEDVAPSLLPGGLLLEEIADTNARPVINRTTGDAVRVVANAGNGDRAGVEIRSLDLTGDDNAIDVSAADANNLDVALSDNVLSSVNGASLLVNGAGSTGTTVVRELGGTSVGTSGAMGGEIFESVTFDADVVTAGIQPVAAGNVNVGNPGSPGDVVGHGVRLNNVLGVLDFGTLNIGNTSGVGLFVRDAGGKAGTFVLDTDGGAINTVNGPAVDLDPVGLGLGGGDGMVLTSVTANVTVGMVPYGINLNTVAGSFQVTGATSVSASGGGTLTSGIIATDATAAITFTGPTTVSGIGGAGIALTNVDGPVTVASTMSNITGAGGAAIDVDQGLGNVTYNGSINNTGGRSVEITNHEGPGGGSTIALTGAITDSGQGIFLDNNDLGAGGTVINLTGALNLTTGGSNAFTATNGGVVNVTDPANNNLAATTTGTGVTIANTTIGGSGVKFTTVNVGDANPAAPNAANGILLSNAGAGSFTATGGAIQNVTTRGLDVAGGTGSVTVGTSISTTTTGRSLEVTGYTGGTVAMSGAIDDNGLGVNLDSNMGGTINVTGSMDIDTVGANIGFNATNGGMINVMTGTNDVNTSAGTGTAVNIANATIGANGVTFRNVSATSASANAGIVLSNTGAAAAGFRVTGDGGGTNNGSGGSISTRTGDGVTLTNATNVSLNYMNIDDNGGNGVMGTSVNGFTMNRANVRRNGTMGVATEACLHFMNLTGSVPAGTYPTTLTSSVVFGAGEDNIRLRNSVGTLSRFLVTGTTIGDAAMGNLNNDDGIDLEASGTATANITVDGSSFVANRGDHLNTTTLAGATVDVVLTNSSLAGGHSSPLGQGVTIASGGGSAATTYNISGNTINGAVIQAINVNKGDFSAGTMSGTINDNTIGTPGVTGSGSSTGIGIQVIHNGAGTHTAAVTNNRIREWENGPGIRVLARDHDANGSGTLNVTVTGNTLSNPGSFGYSLLLQSGATSGDAHTLCANVGDPANAALKNTFVDNPAAFDGTVTLFQRFSTTMNLTSYAGGATSDADLTTYFQARNTGVVTVQTGDAPYFTGGITTGINGGAACPTP